MVTTAAAAFTGLHSPSQFYTFNFNVFVFRLLCLFCIIVSLCSCCIADCVVIDLVVMLT